MGKGGGPNPEQKGGAPVFCRNVGTGPSSPFLDVCHVIVHYHVTNFTDEDWWFQSKRLIKIKIKIPEKRFFKKLLLYWSGWIITFKVSLRTFFKNLFLEFWCQFKQTFRLKPSVFISEVCHVIENYHVTNVEERRRGPAPKLRSWTKNEIGQGGNKGSHMGKGGGPNPERKGEAPVFSVSQLGLGPLLRSSTFVMW